MCLYLCVCVCASLRVRVSVSPSVYVWKRVNACVCGGWVAVGVVVGVFVREGVGIGEHLATCEVMLSDVGWC